MEVITKSAEETQALGRKIAADLKGPGLFALEGNLGSGKTTFVQGFAQGLGHMGRIISPTFIIMRKYPKFYHVDLYRLDKNIQKEIESLGLTDIWDNETVVIEWAEKIKEIMPPGAKWITFENLGGNKRKVTIQ